MTWLEVIGVVIAAASTVEIVIGRMRRLDRKTHRWAVINGHAGMACTCILAASLTLQGAGVVALDVLVLSIAGYLLMTRDEWRQGPPPSALRDEWAGMVPVHADSRQDDGR